MGLICFRAGLAHDARPIPEPLSMDELVTAFGMDFEQDVTTTRLDDGFYVIFGMGGNVLVSSGPDGVLMIDDQFPEMVPKLKQAMGLMGDDTVDFVVNTHWHFDHADGNLVLGQQGTWLVSHANSRKMMQADHLIDMVSLSHIQKAYPPHALPDITFNDSMQFHFNGERIELKFYGPAHTTGDTATIFRGHNTVHMGDVFNGGYPFIDAGNGGSLDGIIKFCEGVLAEINKDTTVVPGHGPISDHAGLVGYIEMLKTVQRDMLAMIRDGKTLEEIQAAGITKRWDEQRGDSTGFVDRAYTSLTRRYFPD
jgi:glyoxylase-like metal-dependent hydrolase (beta-lactamase superfamily II)